MHVYVLLSVKELPFNYIQVQYNVHVYKLYTIIIRVRFMWQYASCTAYNLQSVHYNFKVSSNFTWHDVIKAYMHVNYSLKS